MSSFRASPDLHALIEDKVDGVGGWTPIEQLFALAILAHATPVTGPILEVGAWLGRSTIALGIAARNLGTQVHAIDLFPNEDDWVANFDGTHSFTVEIDGKKYSGYTSQTVWDEPFQKDIAPVYSRDSNLQRQYQKNIEAAGVADFIQTTRGNLQLFYDESKVGRYQLAFLDGDHSYQSVYDEIKITEKMLAPGGVICFDDAHTVYEGVDAAIKSAILSQPHLWERPAQLTRKLFFARKKIRN